MSSNDISWLSEETTKNQENLFESFLSEDESRHCSFSTSFTIYRDTSMASHHSDDNKENAEETEHEDERSNEKENSPASSDSDSYYSTNDVSMMSISSPVERKKSSSRLSKVNSKVPVQQKNNQTNPKKSTRSSTFSTQSSILDDVHEEDQRNLLLELYPELINQSQESVIIIENNEETPSNEVSFQLNIEYVDSANNETVPELIDLTADSFDCSSSPNDERPSELTKSHNKKRTTVRSESSDEDDDKFDNFLKSLRNPPKNGKETEKEVPSRHNDKFCVSDDEIIYTTDGTSSSNDFIDDEEEEDEYDDDEQGSSRDSSPNPNRTSPADVFSKQFNTPSIRVKPSSKYDHFLKSLSINYSGQRHPEAEKYVKKGIKNQKIRDELTEKLFLLFKNYCFNDVLLMDYEHVKWNARLRKTAGLCKNSFRNRTSTIELSTKVCTTPERLRDTLVHELCHAATWLIDGIPKAGHGPVWRRWTKKCLQKFPSLPSIDRCHTYDIEAKYVYVCNGCGQRVKRHSKSLDIQKKICGRCKGRFELNVDNEKKKREPSKFAKFVQDNYGKQKSMGIPHKEIMKALSEKWKLQQLEGAIETTSLDISVMSIND